MTQLCDFGLIGLAVMGENLALNIESRGYRVAVFNRTTSVVDDFIAGRATGKKFVGCHSLEELVKSLAKPRKVMMMVKAGPAVDDADRAAASAALAGRRDHRRRQHATTPTPSAARSTSRSKGLLYIGTGVSGGEEGALKGPSLMPGGSRSRLAAGQADLPGHRRQGRPEERHSLLRMGRPARRRPLREDGPQRHRIRRHAVDLRSLLHAASRRSA